MWQRYCRRPARFCIGGALSRRDLPSGYRNMRVWPNAGDSACCVLRFHSMPRKSRNLLVDITQPRGLLVSFRRVPSKPEGRRMGTKSRHRDRFCGALAAVCAAALPAVADAQNAAIDRIEAIEHKIRGLQGELQHLKSELGAAKQQLRQSRTEAERAQKEAREAREAADRARQDAVRAEPSSRKQHKLRHRRRRLLRLPRRPPPPPKISRSACRMDGQLSLSRTAGCRSPSAG